VSLYDTDKDPRLANDSALKAEVEKVKTVEASAVTLITEIAQRLRDAIAAGDPAALTALAADLDASATTLGDAVAANTPAA
jgi:hypothetical protein